MNEQTPRVNYAYDSLNRLINKTTLSPSPKNHKKLRPNEIYVWKYNEAGELCKVLRYKMVDYLPTTNGRTYFPEKLMLFGCDSISYNYSDSSATIHQNYAEHCTNDSIELHPVEFDQSRKIQLSFHSNGNLKKRTTFTDETQFKVEDFDLYGRSISNDVVTPKMRLFEVLNFTASLPTELNWIEVHDIEIVEDNDTVLIFKSKNALNPLGSSLTGESSAESLTVDLKNRTVHFVNQTIHKYINQMGSYFSSTCHVRVLNFDLQVLEHESWTWVDDNTQFLPGLEIVTDVNPSERYSHLIFYYCENGLLKCFSHFLEGKETRMVVNEVTYFE